MLLRTRFYLPPLKTTQVSRHRLTDQLQQVSAGQLAVICAPAGYGKTTLVSEWLHRFPQSFCWLSLGSEHDSPLMFWRYAISAIQQVAPEIGLLAQRLVEEGASAEEILIALLNDLEDLSKMEHQNHCISLVLDDFHYITDTELLRMIELFMDHLPASVRLILTCRDIPSVNLAKRRATGQLVEINSVHLRFSREETDHFLNQFAESDTAVSSKFIASHHKQWTPESLDQIHQGTEGWVTALQLIAISKQMHLRGNEMAHGIIDTAIRSEPNLLHRHIEDYLFEEVLAGLSAEMQQFMRFAAGLPRFCAGLCNQVLGLDDSQQLIIAIERANLFLVALDNHRIWFRFHDLFKQFLLQTAHTDIAVTTSHDERTRYEDACTWFFDTGHLEDAINTALEHQLWEQAVTYLEHYYRALEEGQRLNSNGFRYDEQRLFRWVQALPEHQKRQLTDAFDIQETVASQQHASNAYARNEHALDEQGLDQKDSDKTGSEAQAVTEPLTKREQQVLALIKQGLSNQVICEQLFISNNTLKVHIRNLYGKMGVTNRREILSA